MSLGYEMVKNEIVTASNEKMTIGLKYNQTEALTN